MASLLANFSGQISKWQQPTPAAVETNLPLVEFFQAASKSFSLFRKHPLTFFSELACSLHSCRSGSLLERHGYKPQERSRGQRTRRRERAG
jgi:hypothetical protein